MLVALIIGMLVATSAAAAPVAIVASSDTLPLEFSQVEYVLDEQHALNFDDVLKLDASKWTTAADSTFEMQPSSVWMRFEVDSKVTLPTLLEHRWNLPLDGATLYWRTEGRWQEMAPIRNFAPMFPITLSEGRHQFYLHLKNCKARTMKTRLQISSAFGGRMSYRDLVTLLYGVTFALVVQNLGWYLLYRRVYFLFYVSSSLSMLGVLAIASFHLPNFTQWLWNSLLMINAVSVFFFMATALSLRRHTPRIFYAMVVLLAGMAGLMATEIVSGRLTPWYVPQVGLYAVAIAAAIMRQRQGYKPAAFFVAGWSVLTLGFIINAQAYAGHVGVIWRYSLYMGFAAESVLFAIAVGFKARMSEVQVTTENTHAFKQMAKVFYPHQIQQIRGGRELEQTMPTGPGEACVICFDIVGSSKINHEKTKDFLRGVFRRCNEAMDRDYDLMQLIASGYRVKEMGDGFICSVGYPFRAPTGSMANDALSLAQIFIGIFSEEVAKFGYHEPLHCCVGLAMDSISGFYPAGGTKSYDLFGRSIVLANRYEAMRKVIFPDGLGAHLLILQERVYYSLNPALRDGFVRYAMRDHGTVVRDDPAAECLYYREVEEAKVLAFAPMNQSA